MSKKTHDFRAQIGIGKPRSQQGMVALSSIWTLLENVGIRLCIQIRSDEEGPQHVGQFNFIHLSFMCS